MERIRSLSQACETLERHEKSGQKYWNCTFASILGIQHCWILFAVMYATTTEMACPLFIRYIVELYPLKWAYGQWELFIAVIFSTFHFHASDKNAKHCVTINLHFTHIVSFFRGKTVFVDFDGQHLFQTKEVLCKLLIYVRVNNWRVNTHAAFSHISSFINNDEWIIWERNIVK